MEYLTVKEIMELLKIGRGTAYKLVNEDGFPAYRIGGNIRVRKCDLDEWLSQHRIDLL